MEKQQINLYKSLPRVSRNWFGEAVVLQIAAGFMALFVLITLVQMVMLEVSKYRAKAMQKVYIETNARFMKEQKAGGGVDLVQLQQELASKKQLLGLLNIKSPDDACPLVSDYFKSLSSTQVPGIWLTRLRIEPVSRNMTFEGSTYDPLLIMSLIKQMGATPCFSGVKFHTINIEKNTDEKSKTMTFALTSVTAPLAKAVGGKI
ncbi:MAG: hypothetical protein SFW07_07805 [Gammaproteobacteria bacterium]|nr:hypothetical protein [Gammaproteobacteria bacterium]